MYCPACERPTLERIDDEEKDDFKLVCTSCGYEWD